MSMGGYAVGGSERDRNPKIFSFLFEQKSEREKEKSLPVIKIC